METDLIRSDFAVPTGIDEVRKTVEEARPDVLVS